MSRYLGNTEDVQNIQHKHTPKPVGYSSWKEYWCYQSEEDWPETCRFRGCGNNASGSSHVIVNDNEDSEYIIPMCDKHSSRDFSGIYRVNSETFAAYIDKKEIMKELVGNLTETFGQFTLEGGMRVKNKTGTHACLPRGYKSWKKYYMDGYHREWPETCRVSFCSQPAKGGAHVDVEWKRGVFIVPMCEHHNTAQNHDWLPVKKGTTVVRVDQEDTSGPAETCFCKKR